MKKSTIETSRKIYAMKHGMYHVTGMVVLYVICVAFKFPVSENIFVAGISAAGVIITAVNIADGMKGHEPAEVVRD